MRSDQSAANWTSQMNNASVTTVSEPPESNKYRCLPEDPSFLHKDKRTYKEPLMNSIKASLLLTVNLAVLLINPHPTPGYYILKIVDE